MTISKSQHLEKKRKTNTAGESRWPYLLIENARGAANDQASETVAGKAFFPIQGGAAIETVAYTAGISYEGLLNANLELKKTLDETISRLKAAEQKIADLIEGQYKDEAALKRKEMEIREKSITIDELQTTIRVLVDSSEF